MAQALEQIIADGGDRAMPSFSRGPEIEITTTQDVEMLKALLAKIKIHIPTKSLERGIIMPRDLDNYHPELPKVLDGLIVNPYKDKKEEKKKKKKKTVEKEGLMRAGAAPGSNVKDLMSGGPLLPNQKLEYRPYEFGNFPLRQDVHGNHKPKSNCYRLMLPENADWSDRAL